MSAPARIAMTRDDGEYAEIGRAKCFYCNKDIMILIPGEPTEGTSVTSQLQAYDPGPVWSAELDLAFGPARDYVATESVQPHRCPNNPENRA